MAHENINAELLQIAPTLAQVPKRNVYSVPDQYFDINVGTVLQKVQLSTNGTPATLPFTTPGDYFVNLPQQILEKIKEQEDIEGGASTDELPETTVLGKLPRKNLYTVPPGYFEQLQPVDTVKRNTISQPRLTGIRRITRYAAAAIITGLLAVAGNKMITPGNSAAPGSTGNSSQIASFNPGDVQELSEIEIDEFLVTHEPSEATRLNPSVNSDRDINNNLKEIPVEEIQEYLKDNPLPGEFNIDG